MDDKLDMQSPNWVHKNSQFIAEHFPNCVTETADGIKVDFDMLRQELSADVIEGNKERYRLEWPGKREAIVTANLPTSKTLRPVREDSVDFDTTENLYIEGDNLEVLKLLQESYLGKIKMIYIDPPYNTGKDFVYKDNFKSSREDELMDSGQIDEYNQRLVANPETAGRYHSDWLSMMYPRLKLARNLLTDDGVIFISIDDNEVENLKKICSEILGEDHWLGSIIWKNATDNNPTQIAIEHEYILVYTKNKARLAPIWKSKISDVKEVLKKIGDDFVSEYSDPEELQNIYSKWYREHKSELWPLDRYKFIDKGGVYTGSQSVHNPGREGYRYDVIHPHTKKPCKQPLMGYRFPYITMESLVKEGKIIFGEDENKIIELKLYASEFSEKLSSIIEFDGRIGSYDLKSVFEDSKRIFTNPKPVKFLAHFFDFVLKETDILLDFYSGSSSSAHALLQLNAIDNGKRKFVQVQIPELTDENSEAHHEGYKNICEIGKERIRRAAKKIKEETGADIDYGFRVYRVDESNMQDVYYKPQDYKQDKLDLFADNVKPDRTADDLVAQVMLDWGLPLSLKIERVTFAGKQVFKVADNSLYACFDTGIDEAFAKEIAKGLPLRIVFRDSGFKDDTAKTNVKQLLKQLSPETEMKVI